MNDSFGKFVVLNEESVSRISEEDIDIQAQYIADMINSHIMHTIDSTLSKDSDHVPD